jgi:hypothetical protein
LGYTLDTLVAALRCPTCGAVSSADDSTNMQTSVQGDPQLAFIGVGDPIEPDIDDQLEQRGYLMPRRPAKGEPLVLLEPWGCPSCGEQGNWARIVIRDNRVESIEAAEFTSEVVDSANVVSADCVDVARELTDLPYDTLVDLDLLPLLREALAKAGR